MVVFIIIIHFKDVMNPLIVILDCAAIEVLTEHLQTVDYQRKILLLDFFICRPAEMQGIFQVETFRFHVLILVYNFVVN